MLVCALVSWVSYRTACKTGNWGEAESMWNRQATHPRYFTWQVKEYEKSSGWYGGTKRGLHLIHSDSAGLWFKLVTSHTAVASIWVAVLSLNTHSEPTEHNDTACTQALSDDMPSMHQPNLQPLLPYKMHLLYVIMGFEVHRQQDISSTSVFGPFIPSVHSTAHGVIGWLYSGKKACLLTTKLVFITHAKSD